jgi:uncharacterized LabA/DUF88 family protein
MNHQILSNQRVAILVDSSNIYMASLAIGVKVDYLKILERLNTRQIVRAICYHVEDDGAKQAGFARESRDVVALLTNERGPGIWTVCPAKPA